MKLIKALPPIFFIFLNIGPARTQNRGVLDLNSLSENDFEKLTISLARGQCFGSCPVYLLKIYGDGRVEYRGWRYVKVKAARDEHIDQMAVKKLVKEFAAADFASLADGYSRQKCKCRLCTDMPTINIELQVAGISYRVSHYLGCGCAPKALWDIEAAIDKAAQSERWTGDVSEQGPFGTTCAG